MEPSPVRKTLHLHHWKDLHQQKKKVFFREFPGETEDMVCKCWPTLQSKFAPLAPPPPDQPQIPSVTPPPPSFRHTPACVSFTRSCEPSMTKPCLLAARQHIYLQWVSSWIGTFDLRGKQVSQQHLFYRSTALQSWDYAEEQKICASEEALLREEKQMRLIWGGDFMFCWIWISCFSKKTNKPQSQKRERRKKKTGTAWMIWQELKVCSESVCEEYGG